MVSNTLNNAGESPLVSIVTPSYNQAQFLEETILSVLNQDYPRIEYIVIDGGSTDESVEIIEKYEGQLAYWVSEPDRGQAHAINKGWQRATGEIVAYLNSDDLYTTGSVTTAVRALLSNPDVCMIYGDALVIDEHGAVIWQAHATPFNVAGVITTEVKMPQPSVFVRRSDLDAVGLLDERLHFCMDYDLWIRLGLTSPGLYLPDVSLSKMRAHAAAKSTAAAPAFPLERRRVLDKIYARDDLPLTVRKARGQAYSHTCFDQAAIAARLNQPQCILQPLLRACVESPAYIIGKPVEVAYLLLRSWLPWWKGLPPTAPSV